MVMHVNTYCSGGPFFLLKNCIDTKERSLYILTIQAVSARELEFGGRSERDAGVQWHQDDPV
jgi:hypothetical protein